MSQVIYYVASSLDGFIARSDGSTDWLSCVEVEGEDYGYAEFFDSVDGLLMGRATFDQIQGFGAWPYGSKPCWTWTHRAMGPNPPSAVATAQSPTEIVDEASKQGLSRLWLVGGGSLAGAFEAERLISAYIISIIPVMLGDGIPIIAGHRLSERLELKASRSYESGLVQLTYVAKRG
jgi:dihydrofolate reductase